MTEQEEADLFSQTQAGENAKLITYLNGLTWGSISAYPEAEVESWTIQKMEAERFLDAGADATLDMAPFITRVCYYHHGSADDESRLLQVEEKCSAVRANAQAWSEVAAFVNGLRARRQEQIFSATTAEAIQSVTAEAIEEVEQFRAAAGL